MKILKPSFGLLAAALCASPNLSNAYDPNQLGHYVLTDLKLVRTLGLEPTYIHAPTGTTLVRLTEEERSKLVEAAHDAGRCGGHELISELPSDANVDEARLFASNVFSELDNQEMKNQAAIGLPTQPAARDPMIERAIADVSETNLRSTVDFLAKYPSRNHKSSDGQQAVQAFKIRIEQTLANATVPFKVDLVAHRATPMNSIRLTIPGSTLPNEVAVAGGHIDSINNSFMGSKSAPGADDNASGSANLLEVARVLTLGAPPERTIEIYWYAGEEGGLLGSAEIAKDAKDQQKKIVGVLQLDMTLFPGSGEFTLGSMTDFTSQSMRDLLAQINRDYIGATIVEDTCGYGCSDHASWYRNGYPTLMPFEATMKKMNGNIHTSRDTVSSTSNFKHSAMFTKIAIAFLMTLSR